MSEEPMEAEARLELTGPEWERAYALAKELARDVDRNEFGKVVTYLKRTRSIDRFFILLRNLPSSPFIRSNRTRGYFERISVASERHLKGLDADRALLVAAWAFRLMTYYRPPTSR